MCVLLVCTVYNEIPSLFLWFLILLKGHLFKSVYAMLIMLLSLYLTKSEF